MPQRPRPSVVLATRIFTPEAAAASFRLDALSRALRDAGARVRVVTSEPPQVDTSHDPTGVEVSRLPSLRDSDGYIRGYLQYLSFDIPLLFRLLARRRPSVLVAEPPPTTGAVVRLVAGALGVPYAYYAADVWSDAARSAGMPGPVVACLRVVESFALRGAGTVIAVNEGVAERVRALGARHVDVVLNGIDTEVFTPPAPGTVSPTCDADPSPHRGAAGTSPATDGQPTPHEAAAPGTPPATMPDHFLVYAGTASEWQGAGVFVDAFRLLEAEHPDLHLVYVGQGSDIPAIRARAAGDPRIHFVGQVPPAEAAAWQARAEAALVSIVPGRGYDFAYPTKVLAALACGTPVVFAGVGPVVEDVRSADLGAVAGHSAQSVAAAIRDVLSRPRDPGRLRAWVQEHRSLEATGRAAARAVLALVPGAD